MRVQEERQAKELQKQVAVPSIHLSAKEAKKEAESYFDSLSSQVHKTVKVLAAEQNAKKEAQQEQGRESSRGKGELSSFGPSSHRMFREDDGRGGEDSRLDSPAKRDRAAQAEMVKDAEPVSKHLMLQQARERACGAAVPAAEEQSAAGNFAESRCLLNADMDKVNGREGSQVKVWAIWKQEEMV
eukprot:581249-Hanusia_phi.AAC.2